jgi:hypothetical protein
VRNRLKFLFPLALFGSVGAIALALVYLFFQFRLNLVAQKVKERPTSQNTLVNIVSPTPSPTPIIPSDWLKYSNDEHLFSFMYPPAAQIAPGKPTEYLIKLTTDSYLISISSPGSLGAKVEDTVNQNLQGLRNICPDLKSPPEDNFQVISGITTRHFFIDCMGLNHFYFLTYQNRTYLITVIYGGSPADLQTYQNEVSTILSSFKFGLPPQNPTSSWTTVNVPKFQLVFKVPAEWRGDADVSRASFASVDGKIALTVAAHNSVLTECLTSLYSEKVTLAGRPYLKTTFKLTTEGDQCAGNAPDSDLDNREVWLQSQSGTTLPTFRLVYKTIDQNELDNFLMLFLPTLSFVL